MYNCINIDITDLINEMEQEVVDQECTESEKLFMLGIDSEELPSSKKQEDEYIGF